MIRVFHEYTYQDHEDIIRAMNTKHAQCRLYTQLVTKLNNMGFPAPGARTTALSHSEYICDQVA